MIDLMTLIEILVGIFVIGGGIVGFFTMQKGQNMKIAQLEKDIVELKRKQSLSTGNQIKTEKDLVEMNTKLDYIIKAIDELKVSDKENHHG